MVMSELWLLCVCVTLIDRQKITVILQKAIFKLVKAY